MRKVITGEQVAQLSNRDPFACPSGAPRCTGPRPGSSLVVQLVRLLAWLVRLIARHPVAATVAAVLMLVIWRLNGAVLAPGGLWPSVRWVTGPLGRGGGAGGAAGRYWPVSGRPAVITRCRSGWSPAVRGRLASGRTWRTGSVRAVPGPHAVRAGGAGVRPPRRPGRSPGAPGPPGPEGAPVGSGGRLPGWSLHGTHC